MIFHRNINIIVLVLIELIDADVHDRTDQSVLVSPDPSLKGKGQQCRAKKFRKCNGHTYFKLSLEMSWVILHV